MPDREQQASPSWLGEMDELIRILELAGTGLLQKQIGEVLGRGQSHVSRQITALRKLIGQPVLNDGATGGERLTDRSRSFLTSLRQARHLLDAALGPERFGSVRLRVGSIPSVITSFMPRVYARLAKAKYYAHHSHVAIHTESGTAAHLFDMLARGLVDIVLSYPLRDANLAEEPTGPKKERAEGEVWRPVQMRPWMDPDDVHPTPLFAGRPVGLIYHVKNRVMRDLARGTRPFSFEPFESMVVYLTSDPTQPAFETEIEKCLPEPKREEGSRHYVQTFNNIRAALTFDGGKRLRNNDALRSKAVGVGVPLDGDSDIEFLDFRDVAKRMRPDVPGSGAVRRLAELSTQRFYSYRISARLRPVVREDLFRELTACIEAAAQGYTHPYVS